MKNAEELLRNLVYRPGYLKTTIKEGVAVLKPYAKGLEVIHIKIDYPDPSIWRKKKYYHVTKQMVCSRLDEWTFKNLIDQNEYAGYLERYRSLREQGKIEDIDEHIMNIHYRPRAIKILRQKKFFDISRWINKRNSLECNRRSNIYWKNGDEYRFDYRNSVESLFICKHDGNKEVIGIGGSAGSSQREACTFFTVVFYLLSKKFRISHFLLKYNRFNKFEYIGHKFSTVLTPGFGSNFELDKSLYSEIRKKGLYWKYA